MNTVDQKKYKKAIVMGASIAGLWAARALADHFEEILIFERDHLPEGAEYRSGAPQVRQFHTLLLSGLRQMRAWFPGLEQELIDAGAVPYDLFDDTRVRVRHRWLPHFPTDQILLSCSRLLLESKMRQRMRQYPQIRFIDGVEVVGLQSDQDCQHVTGIRTRTRGASNNPEADTLHLADLIIDALGRRSRTPEWLVALGYSTPQETEVDSFLGYVTRKYKRKPNTPILIIGGTPPDDPYAGVVFPEEDDTMVALIAGYNKNYPPTDPDQFEAFARNLGPEFQAAVEGAEPISQPHGYRGTSSRWRHYEQLERWPERYIVLGDAFCGFNPIYGQGMSVAAMSAVVLEKSLQWGNGNLDGLVKPILKEISRITEGAWLLAVSSDLEWPGTQGGTLGTGSMDRFGRWYVGAMLDAMAFDNKVRMEFMAVTQLVKPASALFAPPIFLRVMKQTFLKTRYKA